MPATKSQRKNRRKTQRKNKNNSQRGGFWPFDKKEEGTTSDKPWYSFSLPSFLGGPKNQEGATEQSEVQDEVQDETQSVQDETQSVQGEEQVQPVQGGRPKKSKKRRSGKKRSNKKR